MHKSKAVWLHVLKSNYRVTLNPQKMTLTLSCDLDLLTCPRLFSRKWIFAIVFKVIVCTDTSNACPGGTVVWVIRCSVLGLCGPQAPEVWVQLQAPAACGMQVNQAYIQRLMSRAGTETQALTYASVLLNLWQASRTGFKGTGTSSTSQRWDNTRTLHHKQCTALEKPIYRPSS